MIKSNAGSLHEREKFCIYSEPNVTKPPIFYCHNAKLFVILIKYNKEGWMKILTSDGIIGWVARIFL